MRRLFLSAAILAALAATPAAARPAAAAADTAGPRVVASIKPLHSLAAAVMQGVAEPALIVRGGASPHTYAMRPSDARALAGADLVFWVGPELEGFLAKPLEAAGSGLRAVELMEAPGMVLLPAREGGAWEPHDHGDEEHAHDTHDADGDHDHDEVNSHIWLDIGNAQRIVAVMAEQLAATDPAHAAAYRANAARTTAALDALDAELKAELAPVAGKPFIVFHDAYQYAEARYGLTGVGAITVSPDRPPSAKRLSDIRDAIRRLGAVCVFAEPQFEPALVGTIIEGTAARTGTLDPEGAAIPDGPGLYPALMRGLARSLRDCLTGG